MPDPSASLDSNENGTGLASSKPIQPFVYYGRYHPRRARRQLDFDLNQVANLLSSLPMDRLGPIVGQLLNSGLKEVLNPNLLKKLDGLLGSLFADAPPSGFRVPVRSSLANITMAMNKLPSSSPLMQSLRRPRKR